MLKCTMIHSFPTEYFRLYEQFKDGGTFREWNNEVVKLARKFADPDVSNKFKGDMLEVFAEIFFGAFANDEAIGLREYAPVMIEDDYGVDGTGVNANGHRSAIQVKYRGNPEDLITYADIARTFTAAVCQLHIEDVVKEDHTVFLFTNSGGVTGAFGTVMQKKSVIITRDIISVKVDNNKAFWATAYQQMFETLN